MMQLLLCHKTELLSLLLAIGEFPGKGGPGKTLVMKLNLLCTQNRLSTYTNINVLHSFEKSPSNKYHFISSLAIKTEVL